MAFHALFPTCAGWLALAFTLLVAMLLQILGAAIGGAKREASLDLLIGWSTLCVLYFIAGTLTSISFIWVDAIAGLAVIAASIRVRQQQIPLCMGDFARFTLLAFPFLLVAASTQPSAWDEFTHWLPNARYLLDNQHFPGIGRPPSFSSHAGYPYGMPLILYIIESLGRLVGTDLRETGVAPMFNLMLLVTAARIIVAFVKEQRGGHYLAFNPWTGAALALLAVTALCPTFVPTIVLSAYADNATATILLALGFALAARNCRGIAPHCLALLLVLAVCLKEDNALQALLVLAGGGVWQWRTGEKGWRVAAQIALLCVPMLLMSVLWHLYSAHNIPGGEMGIRPVSEWHGDLTKAIAWGFLITALHKSGYFLLAFGLTAYAGWRGLRHWRQDFASGMLSASFATAFIGYNLFLFFAYISIFTPTEGERVASLWRYNTHLGLLEVALAFLLLARLPWKLPYSQAVGAVIVLSVLIAPLSFAAKLRIDQTPLHQATRAIAQDIAHELPRTSHIVLLDLNRNGFDCVIIDHTLGKSGQVTLCMSQVTPEPDLNAALAGNDYIWIDGWPDIATKTLHQTLPADRSHLLKRGPKKGWKEVRNWALLPAGK